MIVLLFLSRETQREQRRCYLLLSPPKVATGASSNKRSTYVPFPVVGRFVETRRGRKMSNSMTDVCGKRYNGSFPKQGEEKKSDYLNHY